MSIKFIYALFIGILFATFVGVGIAAFYVEPKLEEVSSNRGYTDGEYQQKYEDFQKERNIYNRNVSSIALSISVLALIISLTLLKGTNVLADGLLLGGLFLLIYSILRGFNADDNMFRFIVVSVGFAVSLALGYIKFIQPQEKKNK